MSENAEDLRLLITDIGDNPVFSDAQIESFLRLADGDIYRGAARALRTMAASEVLISKKISTQDLTTDGAAVSAELRALAKELDDEADRLTEDDGLDSYASFVPFKPGYGVVEGEEWHR